MIWLIKESKLAPSEVIESSVTYFGPRGWAGLEVTDRVDGFSRFEGGGRHVLVQPTRQPQSKGSEVRVESLEWDYTIHLFLEEI